ncbi:uncharacterized protein K452DRAFT_349773 [Aplosporella prunicola CBS 121167]|uniref:Anaphase-promoting complex subunit 2 n=1 Tax=Aplosporella prunicola CBS 121167 TaxID=1176127 RepID=A0A6A6BPL0_9PEZI|nr:uncharacterized protein K452DRAFT_349773 [Aplosporella prunicola CBS 121167]KAF2144767.1 hypothetical protein K452DRAFT_349773 [Aplosporella prunicola CBS 121167]
MAATAAPSHRDLVFASVFPLASHSSNSSNIITTAAAAAAAPPQQQHQHDASTAGPDTPSSAYATRSHDRRASTRTHHHSTSQPHAHDDRAHAWAIATRALALPDTLPHQARGRRRLNTEAHEALQFLLTSNGAGQPGGGLLEWYASEVGGHFATHVRPALGRLWDHPIETGRAGLVLRKSVELLAAAQAAYLLPLTDHVGPVLRAAVGEHEQRAVCNKFRREHHATVLHSLPQHRFAKTLSFVLYDAGCRLFRLRGQDCADGGDARKDANRGSRSHWSKTMRILKEMQEVGLGGDQAQRAAAHAMDNLMDTFIASHYMKVDWYGRKAVTRKLKEWVKDAYAPIVREIMGYLTGGDQELIDSEVQQWVDMAVGRLGRARVENLFDYIVNWDRSLGAILDLKEYITTPAARNHLTNTFLQQVVRRLLHAGATTTHILDTYIYVIRAFVELDPKGILLEKVARPVRRYLRDREDTARIIVSSLLADVEDDEGNRIDPGPDISIEIAAEMLHPFESNIEEQDQELDWANMDWLPDPVDASPEFKKAKSENVLAYLLSLYEREDFINELKNILGEHLLKNEDSEFEKEIQLLELFKLRLGDTNLQACEVMLKDALESKRMNKQIQQTLTHHPSSPELSAQILSAFFWPALREDEFALPQPIRAAMVAYEKGFEAIKDMRKLRWLPALGRVRVELAFADRTRVLDVLPWQACVVYAFQESEDDDAALDEKERQRHARLRAVGAAPPEPALPTPVSKTVEQLEEQLEMDETLLRAALRFWVGQLVLLETSPDTYTTLETLDQASTSSSGAAASAAEAAAEAADTVSAVKSQHDVLLQNLQVYRQFVLGMLTNQGRMDAGRVTMMLKMALPGGFPFGGEEVAVLLWGMVEEGVLVEVGGGGFAVRK